MHLGHAFSHLPLSHLRQGLSCSPRFLPAQMAQGLRGAPGPSPQDRACQLFLRLIILCCSWCWPILRRYPCWNSSVLMLYGCILQNYPNDFQSFATAMITDPSGQRPYVVASMKLSLGSIVRTQIRRYQNEMKVNKHLVQRQFFMCLSSLLVCVFCGFFCRV